MTPWNTWDGEDDAVLVSIVLNHLNQNLPEGYYAVSQVYIVVDSEEGWSRWYEHVTKQDLAEMTEGMKPFIIHPDVLVVKGPPHGRATCLDKIVCAVELDGSIHDTKPGHKQTDKRAAKYEAGSIPCVVINQADYSLIGKDVREGAWEGVLAVLRQDK